MTQMLKTLFTKTPGFITRDELNTAKQLQSQSEGFANQIARYNYSPGGLDSLMASYAAEPTDKNLTAIEELYILETRKSPLKIKLQPLVTATLKEFQSGVVLQWFRPIWERALALAKERAEKVTQEETERVLALTGNPMTRSDVVAAVSADVDELESLGLACGFKRRVADRPACQSSDDCPSDSILRSPLEWLALFGYDLQGAVKAGADSQA